MSTNKVQLIEYYFYYYFNIYFLVGSQSDMGPVTIIRVQLYIIACNKQTKHIHENVKETHYEIYIHVFNFD